MVCLCSDHCQRDRADLKLLVIVNGHLSLSAQCSKWLPLYSGDSLSDLSVVWQGSAWWESHRLRAGVIQCLPPPLNICMPLTAIALMTCSSWSGPALASLLQLEVSKAPGLGALVYFGRSFGAGRSVSPTQSVSWYRYQLPAFNREPRQFTRVTPSKPVIRTPTPD